MTDIVMHEDVQICRSAHPVSLHTTALRAWMFRPMPPSGLRSCNQPTPSRAVISQPSSREEKVPKASASEQSTVSVVHLMDGVPFMTQVSRQPTQRLHSRRQGQCRSADLTFDDLPREIGRGTYLPPQASSVSRGKSAGADLQPC